MFALISTIDVEKPYRFCETAEVPFPVTEPALFWVDCPEGVTPRTHKYTDQGFVELPKPEPIVIKPTWEEIRTQRDLLLSQSDWVDLPNCPVKNKDKWLTYRQQLRDITETFKSPEDVVWPSTP